MLTVSLNDLAWLRGTRTDPPSLLELQTAEDDMKALKARVAVLDKAYAEEKVIFVKFFMLCFFFTLTL